MKILRNIKISRKSLYSHKLRTLLALSGITIGVASVIVMTAIGRGAERAVIGKINEMGTNLLVVNAGKLKKTGIRTMQGSSIQTLTLEDSEAIARECSSVALAVPGKDKTLKVMYGSFSTQTKIFGTLPAFTEIRNFKLTLGRFFSEEENKASFRLAVIGAEVHKNIFDGKDPLGEIIRISNVPFKVIGVLKAKGVSAEGSNEDNQIIIPIKTALRRVFNIDYISQVFVRSKSLKLMDNTEAEIKDLLRERHRLNISGKPDDFLIDNLLTVINAQKETSRSFGNLITGISAISLFVGGIGILDVMLPDTDGLELCRIIRKSWDIPIIMLTARGDVTDRIVGLELGADDYLAKPFEPRELVARIQAVLRRGTAAEQKVFIETGDVVLHLDKQKATLKGKNLDLTTAEFEMLAFFVKNQGKVLKRDRILDEIRGLDWDSFDRSIDVLVSRLRQKLGDDSRNPKYIKTIWGSGYKFIGGESGD